jgi:hypothetical protein
MLVVLSLSSTPFFFGDVTIGLLFELDAFLSSLLVGSGGLLFS